MKLNLATKKLYTDTGILIKELFCPLKMKYSQLEKDSNKNLHCSKCSKSIIDTAIMDDEGLKRIIAKNPDQCLKLDLNQTNLKIYRDEF